MNARSALASAFLLVGLSTPALASPITYTFSFTASGSLGSQTFSNKSISISMAADTTTVTVIPPPGPANFNHGTTTVSVAGLSVATVTSFLQIYTNFNSFGLSNNNFSILDFAGLASSINAWDLRSSIGPLTPPFISQNWSGASPYIVTDAGALSITAGSASQWRFVAAVPAPGTAGVLGLAGMMAARRRRRA